MDEIKEVIEKNLRATLEQFFRGFFFFFFILLVLVLVLLYNVFILFWVLFWFYYELNLILPKVKMQPNSDGLALIFI